MPPYKVTYFSFMGLAEPIRFMLSYLGEEFEDERILPADWHFHKTKMPFGKVPVVEINGKETTQSMAIVRYLARQANLTGKNDWESLQIDMVMDCFFDFRMAFVSAFFETNEVEKVKKVDILNNEIVPLYLKKFDEAVKNGGFLANGALSWADIFFIASSYCLNYRMGSLLNMDIFESYPNLKVLKDKVEAIPNIKAWIEKRPKTDF